MKHTSPKPKLVYLQDARERGGLSQVGLGDLSGVDRTWISKLEADPDGNPTVDTYDKLVAALVECGGLKAGEKLYCRRAPAEVSR